MLAGNLQLALIRLKPCPIEIISFHAVKPTEDEQITFENGALMESPGRWLEIETNLARPGLRVKMVFDNVVKPLLS